MNNGVTSLLSEIRQKPDEGCKRRFEMANKVIIFGKAG
jgi:hypothetical protein